MARVVFLILILLVLGGRCNLYFWNIRLKINRLPNFNMLFQLELTKFSKANCFHVYRKLITWITNTKGLLTVVKKCYPLTSVTWLYHGLKCKLIEVTCLLCYPLNSYWFLIDRGLRSEFLIDKETPLHRSVRFGSVSTTSNDLLRANVENYFRYFLLYSRTSTSSHLSRTTINFLSRRIIPTLALV